MQPSRYTAGHSSFTFLRLGNVPRAFISFKKTANRARGAKTPLEKEVATYSSVLALRISWTEEPGGLVHGVAKSQTPLSDWGSTHKGNYRLNLTPILRRHVTKLVASSTWGQGGPEDFPQPSHLPSDQTCFKPAALETERFSFLHLSFPAFPFTPQTAKQRSFLATSSHSSCHE